MDNSTAMRLEAANGSTLDASCKELLADKQILAYILKGCVPEFANSTLSDIANIYIEGEPEFGEVPVMPDQKKKSSAIQGISTEDKMVNEGTVSYDVRFYAYAPAEKKRVKLIINVEAQNHHSPGYPLVTRGIYYGSRLISSQHSVEFEHSEYGKIKKVYSIWICMHPPKKYENTITSYSISENQIVGDLHENKSHYDLMTVVMIRLGPKDVASEETLRFLSTLFLEDDPLPEKKRVLEEEFSINVKDETERRLSQMCNYSVGVREKGRIEGLIEAAKSLMNTLGKNPEEVIELLRIPEELRPRVLAALES